jgi:hypothetical protein
MRPSTSVAFSAAALESLVSAPSPERAPTEASSARRASLPSGTLRSDAIRLSLYLRAGPASPTTRPRRRWGANRFRV